MFGSNDKGIFRMRTQHTIFLTIAALACAVLVLAGTANAASITYYLSQTNDPEGWLPDGTQDYLTVTIADSTTVAGDIDVTVEMQSPLTGIADSNFGIDRFLFNSNITLDAADIINEPGDWSVSVDFPAGPPMPLSGDGFGSFNLFLDAGTRQDPSLSFSISTAGDSLADYAQLSTGSSQGDSYFAAHVAGFLDQDPDAPLDPIDIGDPGIGECYDTDGMGNYTPGCNILTSAWFGGTSTTPVPEPTTASLLALGLLGISCARRLRR